MKRAVLYTVLSIVFLVAFACIVIASTGAGSIAVVVNAAAANESGDNSTTSTHPSGGGGKGWDERFTRAQDVLKAQEGELKEEIKKEIPQKSESASESVGKKTSDGEKSDVPKLISEKGFTNVAEKGLYAVLTIASFLLFIQILFIAKEFLIK